MRYLALGDSISIDDYTGVEGGGAVSQLAARLGARGADLQDLTRDGNTTDGVLADLQLVNGRPDLVTLTAGGNDFLKGRVPATIAANVEKIARQLVNFRCTVILNTVYDPTDGDQSLLQMLGLSGDARQRYSELNDALRGIAGRHGFLLADLEALFHGHGVASAKPWFVLDIEPNHAGATAIAGCWHGLLESHPPRPPRQVRIEGYTPVEILALPDEQVEAFVFTGEPLVIKVGSAELLGEFRLRTDALVVELAQIEGGGEGVLPTLTALAARYAAQRGLAEVEWIVHAVTCAQPNLKLRQTLERRGFVIEDIPGTGMAYHYRQPIRRA
jgi:lysophospholipase L1-like esterase